MAFLRPLNLLTALSLLLCVAVVALSVRSQFRADHIVYQAPLGRQSDVSCRVDLYTGNLRVHHAHCQFPAADRERFAMGARGGKREGLFSWTVMRYDIPHYTPAWAGRLHWNFSLPRFTSRRDPRTNLWEVQGVTLVQRSAVLPFWILGVLFAALPVARAAKPLRAARRARRGLCRQCGYDLRESPGRCPECGAPALFDQSAAAADPSAGEPHSGQRSGVARRS